MMTTFSAAPVVTEQNANELVLFAIRTANTLLVERAAMDAKVATMLEALYAADRLMGHDDKFTEWREKYGAIMTPEPEVKS